MSEDDRSAAGQGSVVDLEPLLRRVIGARVSDPATVDDLVQETLVRVLAAEARLDRNSLGPYAIVTARNLVRSLARSEDRRERRSPRLLDPRQPQDPADSTTDDEDRRALAEALAQLPPRDRESVLAHHVEGVDTATLGEQVGASPRAMSVRLARARARLRVEYLLALSRTELPTPACKPVLLAVSSGDKRRQRALAAGDHLLGCPACSALSRPLLQRRRPLAALLPALGLGRLVDWLRRQARARPVQTAGAATGTVGAVVLVAVLLGNDQPAPSLVVQRDPPIVLSGDKPLAPYNGQPVRAQGVKVQAALNDVGFWVGESVSNRVWVDLESGRPLSRHVAVGQRVSFVGKVAGNSPGVLEHFGTDARGDREQLERQGYHVEIVEETLKVEGPPEARGP